MSPDYLSQFQLLELVEMNEISFDYPGLIIRADSDHENWS